MTNSTFVLIIFVFLWIFIKSLNFITFWVALNNERTNSNGLADWLTGRVTRLSDVQLTAQAWPTSRGEIMSQSIRSPTKNANGSRKGAARMRSGKEVGEKLSGNSVTSLPRHTESKGERDWKWGREREAHSHIGANKLAGGYIFWLSIPQIRIKSITFGTATARANAKRATRPTPTFPSCPVNPGLASGLAVCLLANKLNSKVWASTSLAQSERKKKG